MKRLILTSLMALSLFFGFSVSTRAMQSDEPMVEGEAGGSAKRGRTDQSDHQSLKSALKKSRKRKGVSGLVVDSLNGFPEEMIVEVFKHLDPKNLSKMATISSMCARIAGDKFVFKEIIKKHSYFNIVEAAKVGNVFWVNLFLRYGSVDEYNNIGKALVHAAKNRHKDIVRILIAALPDVILWSIELALAHAIGNGDKETAGILFEGSTAYFRSIGGGLNIGESLAHAANWGYKETLRMLLDVGGDKRDIGMALYHASKSGREDIVRILLKVDGHRAASSKIIRLALDSVKAKARDRDRISDTSIIEMLSHKLLEKEEKEDVY